MRTVCLLLCAEWSCVLQLLLPGKAWGEVVVNAVPDAGSIRVPCVRVHRKSQGLPCPSHKAALVLLPDVYCGNGRAGKKETKLPPLCCQVAPTHFSGMVTRWHFLHGARKTGICFANWP